MMLCSYAEAVTDSPHFLRSRQTETLGVFFNESSKVYVGTINSNLIDGAPLISAPCSHQYDIDHFSTPGTCLNCAAPAPNCAAPSVIATLKRDNFGIKRL